MLYFVSREGVVANVLGGSLCIQFPCFFSSPNKSEVKLYSKIPLFIPELLRLAWGVPCFPFPIQAGNVSWHKMIRAFSQLADETRLLISVLQDAFSNHWLTATPIVRAFWALSRAARKPNLGYLMPKLNHSEQ